MTRWLYSFLLALHPAGFRRQYGQEILGIFDEAMNERRDAFFITDLTLSLLRHRVLRSRIWLAIAAVAGAVITFAAAASLPSPLPALETHSMHEFLVIAAVATLLCISPTMLLCVLWFRFVRRCSCSKSGI